MEGGESLLDTLFDEEGVEDVEMLDVEEGELTDHISKTRVGESSGVGGNQENQESNRPKSKHRKKKRKNKRNRGGSTGPHVTNINRFVLDACKHLREKKSYLMYTAVGCLGVMALSDIIKEVDAIQACGGQMTADGSRLRSGGGILWNIIKSRDPNAYKEIMTKGREFEKQFKQKLHDKQEPKQFSEETSFKRLSLEANPSDGLEPMPRDHSQQDTLTAPTPCDHSQQDTSTAVQKRRSVHDRIRVPVSYDDLPSGEDPKDELA